MFALPSLMCLRQARFHDDITDIKAFPLALSFLTSPSRGNHLSDKRPNGVMLSLTHSLTHSVEGTSITRYQVYREFVIVFNFSPLHTVITFLSSLRSGCKSVMNGQGQKKIYIHRFGYILKQI